MMTTVDTAMKPQPKASLLPPGHEWRVVEPDGWALAEPGCRGAARPCMFETTGPGDDRTPSSRRKPAPRCRALAVAVDIRHGVNPDRIIDNDKGEPRCAAHLPYFMWLDHDGGLRQWRAVAV